VTKAQIIQTIRLKARSARIMRAHHEDISGFDTEPMVLVTASPKGHPVPDGTSCLSVRR
jgi:hypothetical protein